MSSKEAENNPTEVILKFVYNGTHNGSITDMDTCQRKPYLVTCSREDQSLRLWNYRKRVSIATKIFTSESQRPLSCSIDPTGNAILVCFPGRIQIFYIHVEGLKMDREIICRGARKHILVTVVATLSWHVAGKLKFIKHTLVFTWALFKDIRCQFSP